MYFSLNRLTATCIAVFATFRVAFAKLNLQITPYDSEPVVFTVSDRLKLSVDNDCFIISDEAAEASIKIGDIKNFKYISSETTGIHNVSSVPTVSVDGTTIKIQGVSSSETCRILSVSGSVILSAQGGTDMEIPLSRLHPGAYILTIDTRVILKFFR